MLHFTLRTWWTPVLFMAASVMHSQVTIDRAVVLTGGVEDRRVEGLARPSTSTDLLTVEASLIGVAHWSEAVLEGNVILLTPTVELTSYRTGQLLRFVAPGSIHDSILVACAGLPPLPLVRPDGMRPVRGQLRPNALCEVLNADDRWILLNLPERGCPDGTLAVNDRSCIEIGTELGMSIFNASERCTDMGGRLCSWGEFHYACVTNGVQLGMGTAWEWVDDTSNHKHGAVVVGQTGCTAQRWTQPSSTARGRCCFEPR